LVSIEPLVQIRGATKACFGSSLTAQTEVDGSPFYCVESYWQSYEEHAPAEKQKENIKQDIIMQYPGILKFRSAPQPWDAAKL
jgi:hypothetical protein